jgi:hypothetical protein
VIFRDEACQLSFSLSVVVWVSSRLHGTSHNFV